MTILENSVTFNLGEQEISLKPTLRATKLLSRKYGGLSPIVGRLSSLELDVIVDVITQGHEFTELGAKGLDEKVFSAGTMRVAPHCIEYIHILANGGRRSSEENPPNEKAD